MQGFKTTEKFNFENIVKLRLKNYTLWYSGSIAWLPLPLIAVDCPCHFSTTPTSTINPHPHIFTLPLTPLLCQLVNFFACYSHSVLSIFAFPRFVCKNFAESFIFLTLDHQRTFTIYIFKSWILQCWSLCRSQKLLFLYTNNLS